VSGPHVDSQSVAQRFLTVSFIKWPSRMLGPMPNLRELNLICWGLFLVGLLVPLAVVTISRKQVPDADFVYFYAMGRILNELPAQQLYDYELQQRVCMEIHPIHDKQYGPNPYPPFVGLFFRPFALIPYPAAYALWLLISLSLYVTGIALAGKRFFPEEPLRRSLILCFALSFFPFTIDTMANGQLSAVGFLALTLALLAADAGHPMLSGLALSACLYKPTLLVLILPMLIVTKRFRAMLGFSIGASAVVVLVTVVEGTRVWSGYINLLVHFGKSATGVTRHSFLRLSKYVDLTSFSSLAPGGRSWLGLAIIVACAGWAALSLFECWQSAAKADKGWEPLVWAATITWTLLINAYVPRHDSILIVLSFIVTASFLRKHLQPLSRGFMFLVLLTWVFSWITDRLADSIRIQIITILLAGVGMVQLAALRDLLHTQSQTIVEN